MTERPSLFRREALEFHRRQTGQGGVLRIEPPWTRWSYWTVLALVAAGLVVAATARTSETTSGPAWINVQQRTYVALVPDAASPDLRRGQIVHLRVNGLGARVLAARVLNATVADPARVRRAGFASSSQPAVLVTGVLERDDDLASLASSRGAKGRAVVVLRSQGLLDLFARQLRGMLGTGGGS
jgi:hypothetical protein